MPPESIPPGPMSFEPAQGPASAIRQPFVIVVGCPRSGTTLLQRMLDAHPMLAVANDTHFIPKPLGRRPADPNPRLTPDLVAAVRGYHRFHRLGVGDDAVEAAARAGETYADFIHGLYAAFAAAHHKPYAGEKTPDYVRKLLGLAHLLPQTKFVHIVRDGRDVALSALGWAHQSKGPGRFALWQRDPIAVCALWWTSQAGAGRRDGQALGPERYLEIRYEALVEVPERVLGTVTEFLGLPYAQEMVDFHVGKARPGSGRSAKSAWLPATAGLRSWRDELTDEQVEVFELLAGPALELFGYARAGSGRDPALQARAEAAQRAWTLEKSQRREGEPTGRP